MFKKLFLLLFMSNFLAVGNAFSETCYDFIAGQNIVAGSVCVTKSDENLEFKFNTIDNFLIDEVHLYVGDLAEMPATKKGNPKVGNFPYKQEDINTNTATLVVPLSSIGNPACDSEITFAAHAAVFKDLGDGKLLAETAWTQGERIVEKGNWAMSSTYVLECGGTGPQVGGCETAFAVGDTTFIDLGLSNSRWGWEITNIGPGSYSAPIYAGAGQNDLSKGTHVGNLVYVYDGSSISVDFNMFAGFVMDETHLFVGTDHTTTIAPGLYGNQNDLNFSSSDSYVIGGFNGEPLFLVAHAVSCSLIQ